MESGTAEIINRRARMRSYGARRPGGGGTGGNGNNGDDGDFPGNDRARSRPYADKAKIVGWFLLLVVMMTFGGLIGAYIVIATSGAAEWRPFALPIQVWFSTALILMSSATYHTAKRAFDLDDQEKARKFLIATTVLGAAFISSQILVWMALVNRGFYMAGNQYAGFFYILTAAHALHVLGGIVALGCIMIRSWLATEDEDEILYRQNLARSVGWYWHLMGGLWLVLFLLLGFWQ